MSMELCKAVFESELGKWCDMSEAMGYLCADICDIIDHTIFSADDL